MTRLFVYGTLMQGQANHRVLLALGARRLGPAMTTEPRTLIDLGPYPALLAADTASEPPGTCVAGELYEVADEALGALDEFEGSPDLYRRERIVVALTDEGDGGATAAWTYVLATGVPRDAEVIASGRFGFPSRRS
jgi:gamma-glutamylcyclotransferase (GGCT)/AIG2-like uncharacterized protein YtfP